MRLIDADAFRDYLIEMLAVANEKGDTEMAKTISLMRVMLSQRPTVKGDK